MKQRVNLRHGNRKVRRTKKFLAPAEKWHEQRNLRRIDEIIHDLNAWQIQPQNYRDNRAQRRGPTQHWNHAQGRAQRHAQRNFLRRYSLPQQIQNRPD